MYYIAKNFLPLLQQIADWLKEIGLVGTLCHTSWYLMSTSRYKGLNIRHARVILETTDVKIGGQTKGHTKVKCIPNDRVCSS